MSYADDLFIRMSNDILKNGVVTFGEIVRAKWSDGSDADTFKLFGVINRYDLSKEFPILTLRPTPLKNAVDEMLWIWQKKSNNVNDLGSHVWDAWADETGSIGKAYGYQISQRYVHHVTPNIKDVEYCLEKFPSASVEKQDSIMNTWAVKLDQIDGVIYDLHKNPYSRRILTNIYNFKDLHEMGLYPCAYSMTFNVTVDVMGNKVLNGILNQRSQDVLTANNWNVVQYAVLLHMLARECDMQVGELIHVIADAHIYDKHVPIIKELIKRPTYPAPKFVLNPEKHDFYSFNKFDVFLQDYQAGEQIKNIPVAI